MDAGAPQRLEQSDQPEDCDDRQKTSGKFPTLDRAGNVMVRGRIIFPGVAFGHAFLEMPLLLPIEPAPLDEKTIPDEINKLENAVELAHSHLELHVREHHAPAEEDLKSVLAAHLMMLEDRGFFASIEDRIKHQRISALQAVRDSFATTMQRLATSNDEYMRTRVEDLRDLCQNIQRALMFGVAAFELPQQNGIAPVYVSPNLQLSSVLRARRLGAVAFVTGSAAFTSHGSILLRASGLPSLGDIPLSALEIEPGVPLLVDANEGEVVVRPATPVREAAMAYESVNRKRLTKTNLSPIDARLPEGETVRLFANINHPSQVDLCLLHRLSGVGLLRTEFLALGHGCVPTEDEQYEYYRDAVTSLAGRPLVIRTFDFGADKEPNGLNECSGRNPALGVRGIRRHLLRYPNELRQQLRAIFRASVDADVSVLLPVVTNLQDVCAAKAHIEEVWLELKRANIPHGSPVKLGAMIETPSAALQVDRILDVVDFISVGTNDLLQYLTASDRDNPEVLSYQQPDTSGLYRLLEFVMNSARSKGRASHVSVCGELASEPEGAAALAKIGIRCLSVVPASAAAVRERLGGHLTANDSLRS